MTPNSNKSNCFSFMTSFMISGIFFLDIDLRGVMCHITVSHSSNILIFVRLHRSEERWSSLVDWVESNIITKISHRARSSTSVPDLSIYHLFSGFPCHPTYRFTFCNLLSFFSDHLNLESRLSNLINSSGVRFFNILSRCNLSKDNWHSVEFSMEINLIPLFISRSITSLNGCSIWEHMDTFFNNHVVNNFGFWMILLVS
jgi:hypothetical protein